MKKGENWHNTLLFGVFIVLASLMLFWPRMLGDLPKGAPLFPQSSMDIDLAGGKKISFKIEVATTPQQEAFGLMFRKSLADDAGMFFVFNPPQTISMWMKNTYIPLDMLFVRADGVITKIVTNAQPFDLTPITSNEPVAAVVEISGGEAARGNIQVNDKVSHPPFLGP